MLRIYSAVRNAWFSLAKWNKKTQWSLKGSHSCLKCNLVTFLYNTLSLPRYWYAGEALYDRIEYKVLLPYRYFLNHTILKSDFLVVSILSWKPFLLDFPPFHGMMYSHHLHHYILFPIQSLYGSIGYIISISWKMNKKPCTYYEKSR